MIKNIKDFTGKLRKQKLPKSYMTVSFDVVSLYMNAPLDETIHIILRRIYERKEIIFVISKGEIRELLKNTYVKKMYTLHLTIKHIYRMRV